MNLNSDFLENNICQIENLCKKSREAISVNEVKSIISNMNEIKQLTETVIKSFESKTENNITIPDLSSKKILIVEDNNVNLMVAQAFLKKTGCITETAENGKEALDKIYKSISEPFDLVFMDIQMPVMDGTEAIKELRKKENSSYLRNLPVIAMTGNVFEEELKKAISDGFTDYITKPVTAAVIYEKCAAYTSVSQSLLVTKPVSKEKKLSEPKHSANYPDFHSKKILVVDDNKLNVEIINLMVKKTGASFVNAFDGQEALNKFLQSDIKTYDLVLLDIQMPVMDGNTCAEKIRNSGRPDANIPIIAISANAFQEDQEKSLKAGINFHMSKPVNMKALHEKMNELIG